MDFEGIFWSILRGPNNEPLRRENDWLVASCGQRYPIVNNIPRFVSNPEAGQDQVRATFAYKWERSADWGIDGNTSEAMEKWILPLLGWQDAAAYSAYLARAKVILDAGCGNGRETIRLARLNTRALVVGLDISSAVDVAMRNAAGLDNVRFVQADLCSPPLARETFDFILSFGVLHHTPDTSRAFRALVPLLSPAGEFSFYVYRKKAPLREFSDDHVRSQIRQLTPEAAWVEMEKITLFGKALSDLKAHIETPSIPVLGIEAGRHDLQRLFYYTILKCYWRDGLSLDENTHVNFDWFYPQYAWRHTPEEIREWLREAGVREVFANMNYAGLVFRVARNPD